MASQPTRKLKLKLKRGTRVVISAAFLTGSAIWGWGRRLLGKGTPPRWTILYYHSIAPEHRLRFSKQMNLLRKFTTPLRITDCSSTRTETKCYSSVTFDDAFETVLDNALPELQKRQIPATIFVTTQVLGQPATWWPESAPEAHHTIMSAEQLTGLPVDLISIGSHTLTHPMLTSLSEPEARRELSVSKIELGKLLGRPISLFSFPYSDYNEKLLYWCRDAGYTHVFAGQTVPTDAVCNAQLVLRGRISVEPTDWTLEFCLKALGAYAWLPYAVSLKRSLLSNRVVGKAYVRLAGVLARNF